MTFGEFKNLDYPDYYRMEEVLANEFYHHRIHLFSAIGAYTEALERERHNKESLFNEASAVIAMKLSGNYKGEHKESLIKRAIHILNLNKTFPSNVYNKEYGYTDEDKKEWDENMKLIYDFECEEENK